MYIPVKAKLGLSLSIAIAFTSLIVMITIGWAESLSVYFHPIIAWAIVTGIAIIPGFTIGLIYSLLLFDNRPQYEIPDELPDTTILIAAFNEEKGIGTTLESIEKQEYPGKIHVMVIDDGSTDGTVEAFEEWVTGNEYNEDKFEFTIHKCVENGGKAAALNIGLGMTTSEYIVTIDADTYLYKDAVAHLITNIHSGPEHTAAVAGNILVRNSRENLLTAMQEWEYFMSIAASKRSQSLLQGTLVAQGAISAYKTELVREMGGWNTEAVGEDIVLTWGLQEKGYRVAYAEKAIAFTDVPTTYGKFFKQRERWARGMIEAFKIYPRVIFRLKLTSPFIWVNVLLPLVDGAFLFAFIPGLIAAVFFGWYEIVSLMTLWIVPLIIVLASFMLVQHKKIFDNQGLRIRKKGVNIAGLVFWAFTYMFLMCPATVYGYVREVFNLGKKTWGTK